MKIISWNINGINSLLNQSSESMAQLLDRLDADILCFQEFKLSKLKAIADILLVDDHESYISCSKIKQGYSGVTTYTKTKFNPCHAEEGFSHNSMHLYPQFTQQEITDFDSEGRVIITDHGLFLLFNIYFPNDPTPERHAFKMTFYSLIQTRITDLIRNGRNVIIVGDLNTCHLEIDHCDPVQSVKDHNGISFTEYAPRKWMNDFLNGDSRMIDLYRHFNPTTTKAFTCWNTQLNARQLNYGTRIDYIICNEALLPWFKSCTIHPSILGSDHCPVSTELFDTHPETNESLIDAMHLYYSPDRSVPVICTLNWPEFQLKQMKLTNFFKRKIASGSDQMDLLELQESLITENTFVKETNNVKQSPEPIQKASIISNRTKIKKQKTTKQPSISEFFQKRTPLVSDSSSRLGTHSELTEDSQTTVSNQSHSQSLLESQSLVKSQSLSQHTFLNSQSPITQSTISKPKSIKDILKPISIPVCLHGIPSKEFTVNKPGPNKGKRFFVCIRAPGEGYMENTKVKSMSEVGISEFKCDFFQWATNQTK